MTHVRVLSVLALSVVLFLSASLLSPVQPVMAYPPGAPPMQSPTPTPEPNPITQIINQIIQFPFENLTQALQNALQSMLNNSVAPLESIFSASIGRWLTSSPGIVTPGGGIANGEDVMGPAWRLMIKIAVLLWPLTLAIIAAIAAKDAVAAASWGIGDLKEALGGWLIAVVGSATSLYWMDLANRFTNATTMAILNLSFTGEAGFQPNALTGLVFGTAGVLLSFLAPPASLFIVIFVILLGLAVLTALIFQFMARFVVLYVLVALAPVVIILGVLPPMRWFSFTWLRGFVLAEAIGPINALLLKLVMILTVRGASNDPISAFVNFIGALGVLSILLTIDGVIIKSVFGAVQEIAEKAMSTVTGIATLALAGVTALAGGSIAAAGGVGATRTRIASGGTGGGAGIGSGGAGIATTATSTSPSQTARNAFNPSATLRAGSGAALRGAGDVLYRQPGIVGSVGAAMRSLGGSLEQHQRGQQTAARWQAQDEQRTADRAASQAYRDEQQARWRTQEEQRTAERAERQAYREQQQEARQGRRTQSSVPQMGRIGSDTAPSSPLTVQDNISPRSGASSAVSGTSSALPVSSDNSEPTRHGHANTSNENATGDRPGSAALPPPQTPSVSPMGEALRPTPSATSASLAPEAASTLDLLPAPLHDRGANIARQYAPQDQAAVARATVESLSALEFTGQFSNPGAIASAWDRGMAPVLASARGGLPLTTMAQDAGFGNNVAGYITQRVTHVSEPRLETPVQAVPWHPQLAPHDWEMGSAISQAVGSTDMQPGTAARLYHEIRSPESGGWSAGTQFIQTIQDALHGQPGDPIAALNARLTEMESRGQVSASAMALWRANIRGDK